MRTLLARITEIAAPARLGRSFRWLLSSTVINTFKGAGSEPGRGLQRIVDSIQFD